MAGSTASEHVPASDWWPYRTQMLITFGVMKAMSLGVQRLLIGTVKSNGVHLDGTRRPLSALHLGVDTPRRLYSGAAVQRSEMPYRRQLGTTWAQDGIK